ncbi:MAG: Ig-like domain-containing protein, partial [Actinomycetota bacterium]|nr:Ig-like domain-containing protein [Actinomycetota bacterium]
HDGSPLTVQQPTDTPPGDPVLLAVADVASCWSSGDEAVARLVDTLPGIVAIAGDTEQNNATAAELAGCYEPTWGRHRWRTRPAVGDHEYRQPGATPYWDYFGAAAGTRGEGWYSYDVGSWHVVVLNSNCAPVGGCGPGSPQYEWLQRDLAANAKSCTAAYFHHPLFSAGALHGGRDHVRPFWDLLYQHGAEFVYGGNDHTYQRFAPQTPEGTLDRAHGIRQFVVGTGGTQLYPLGPPHANTEVQDNSSFGVLRLTLKAGSYAWRFLPQAGHRFTDEGETACSTTTGSTPPPPPADTTAPGVALTAPADAATVSGSTVRVAADATDAGGVARVEFLAGGSPIGTDTTAPYETTWDTTKAANGTVAVTARAVDAAGNAASTTRSVSVQNAVAAELVANGSFETSLTGWGPYNATAARVSGGASGDWSARVTYAGSGSSFSYISTPVALTPAGVTYTARAWLRSPAARRVCLRIRERTGGTSYGPSTCFTGSAAWQQTPALSYVSRGGGPLDVYAYQDVAPVRGDAFDLDGVSLRAG